MRTHENETALLLSTFTIAVCVCTAFALQAAEPEVPLSPKRIKVIQIRGDQKPMSAKERVENVFYGLRPPKPPQPEDIWNYARRTDG